MPSYTVTFIYLPVGIENTLLQCRNDQDYVYKIVCQRHLCKHRLKINLHFSQYAKPLSNE